MGPAYSIALSTWLTLITLSIGCWWALRVARRFPSRRSPLWSGGVDVDAPHEPGLGRLIRECEARGLFANTRPDGKWYWHESEYGTRYDVPPIGSFGPFASIELALRDALRHEVQP